MRIITIRDEGTFNEAVIKAAEILENGGVVMHSTDTCFGLAASIFSQSALNKVYDLKRMAADKPVSVMVSSLDMAFEYGDFSKQAIDFAKSLWPGPVTCVVQRGLLLPKFLNPLSDKVGLRFPEHKFSMEMLMKFGGPVTTTSANISGMAEVKSVEEYLEQMLKNNVMPDLIVSEADYSPTAASTIVDFTLDRPKILREGSKFDEVIGELAKWS